MRKNLLLAISVGALASVGLLALTLAAWNDTEAIAQSDGAPTALLPRLRPWLPTLSIASAKDLPGTPRPNAANGIAVNAFATGLDHPHAVYVLPNGDVLVAERNAPARRPHGSKGTRGQAYKELRNLAHAGIRSTSQITLLRDADGDGIAEIRSIFIKGLDSPESMALVGHDFYIADSDAILKSSYQEGQTKISAPCHRLTDLPAGAITHHWTKDLTPSPDGTKLYVMVGSSGNVEDNDMEVATYHAAVLEIDRQTGKWRVFASGLRDPSGPSWNPQSGELWVTLNERDEIGDDPVSGYMTSVKYGGFYGWRYSYPGQHVDTRIDPQRPELVANAIVPDHALGVRTASLALAFNTGNLFPQEMAGGAFIGQRAAWNHKAGAGYKVVFVPFAGGKPSGPPRDILTGFLDDEDEAQGGPIGVRIARDGALLVADDVGKTIWRVTPATHSAEK